MVYAKVLRWEETQCGCVATYTGSNTDRPDHADLRAPSKGVWILFCVLWETYRVLNSGFYLIYFVRSLFVLSGRLKVDQSGTLEDQLRSCTNPDER